MKTKTLALIALSALVLSVVATVAVASSTSTSTSTQSNFFQNGPFGWFHGGHGHQEFRFLTCTGLTVGETITASGLVGEYSTTATPRTTGTASGTFTFQVTAIYAEGCALSITSGSFTLTPMSTTSSTTTTTTTASPTTYTITGGSVVLGLMGNGGGSGTTSGGGTFLIQVTELRVISTSTSSTTTTTTTTTTTSPTVKAAIGLDFKIGASEFLVHLQTPFASPDADAGNSWGQ